MTKKTKFIIAGIILIAAGYFGFYYYVTHDFEVNISFHLRQSNKDKLAQISKLTNKEKALYKKIVKEHTEKMEKCMVYFNSNKAIKTCNKKTNFYLNPYTTQKKMKECFRNEALLYIAKESKNGFENCNKKK